MKRLLTALCVILALVIGAGTGVLWSVQAGQVQAVLGARAPGWLSLPSPQSHLPEGQVDLAQGALRVTWADLALTRHGPLWRVEASGDGLTAKGRAQLQDAQTMTLDLTEGRLDLARALPPSDAKLSGVMRLLTGTAEINPAQQTIGAASARGITNDLSLLGQNFGDFATQLTLLPLQWRADLTSLPENPIKAEITVSQLTGQQHATVELELTVSEALDAGLVRMLSRIGSRVEGIIRVQQTIPMP